MGSGRALLLAATLAAATAQAAEVPRSRSIDLKLSGIPATLEDCRRAGLLDAEVVVNQDDGRTPLYSNLPRSLRRWCYARGPTSRKPGRRP